MSTKLEIVRCEKTHWQDITFIDTPERAIAFLKFLDSRKPQGYCERWTHLHKHNEKLHVSVLVRLSQKRDAQRWLQHQYHTFMDIIGGLEK